MNIIMKIIKKVVIFSWKILIMVLWYIIWNMAFARTLGGLKNGRSSNQRWALEILALSKVLKLSRYTVARQKVGTQDVRTEIFKGYDVLEVKAGEEWQEMLKVITRRLEDRKDLLVPR